MALFALLGLVGCGLPTPYSAAELAERETRIPRATVHYLRQPDADPRVCDMDGDGPKLPSTELPVLVAVERATFGGIVDSATAARCWSGLLRTLPNRAQLADRWFSVMADRLESESLPDGIPALADVLLNRPVEVRLTIAQAERHYARLAAIHHPLATKLAADIEIEAGRYDGQVVDMDLLMSLKEPELEALARRLPDASLRYQAAALLVSLRARRSPYGWVRANSDRAQALALEHGFLPVPDDAVVLGASWDAGERGARVIRIQARPHERSARLVGARTDREVTARPVLDLVGSLQIQVDGFDERPMGPCVESRWDPTPCVPPDRFGLHDRFASMDGSRVALRDDLTLDDVVLLARGGDRFAPPLMIGGVPVRDFAFQIHFDPVPPLAYGGGRDLLVDVYEISNDRLLVGIKFPQTAETAAAAVVPRTDVGFRISSTGSVGARGSAGSNGAQGATGSHGSPGSCYSAGGSGGPGGTGGAGGNGGPGGAGGRGGDILVTLHCDTCDPIRAFASAHIVSLGGPGGPGGPGGQGGQGGPGGPGGSGGSCYETDYSTGQTHHKSTSSGSSGPSGSQGPNGSPGPAGPDGPPGDVVIRIAE